MNLNPGIRRLVAWLNEHNFKTIDSGDGATHDHECDRDHPYVVIQLEAPAFIEWHASRLKQLLENEGIEFDPAQPHGPFLQANYSPVDGYAFLEVLNLTDDMIWPAEDA